MWLTVFYFFNFLIFAAHSQLTPYSGPGSHSYFQHDYQYNGNIDDLSQITCGQYITSFINSSIPIQYYTIQITQAMKEKNIVLTTCCSSDQCSNNNELSTKYNNELSSTSLTGNYDDWCKAYCAANSSLDTVLYSLDFKKNRLRLHDFNDDNKMGDYQCFNSEKSSLNLTSYEEGLYFIAVTGFDQTYNEQNNAYLLQLDCEGIAVDAEDDGVKSTVPDTFPVWMDILLIAITCLLVFGTILLFYCCQVKKKMRKQKKKKEKKQEQRKDAKKKMTIEILQLSTHKSKIGKISISDDAKTLQTHQLLGKDETTGNTSIVPDTDEADEADEAEVKESETHVQTEYEQVGNNAPIMSDTDETEVKESENKKSEINGSGSEINKSESEIEIKLSNPIKTGYFKENSIIVGYKVKLKWETWQKMNNEGGPPEFTIKRKEKTDENWERLLPDAYGAIKTLNHKNFEVNINGQVQIDIFYQYQIELRLPELQMPEESKQFAAKIMSNIAEYVPTIKLWTPKRNNVRGSGADYKITLRGELPAESPKCKHTDDTQCRIKYKKSNNEWVTLTQEIQPNDFRGRNEMNFKIDLDADFTPDTIYYFQMELVCGDLLWASNIVRGRQREVEVRYMDPNEEIEDQLLRLDPRGDIDDQLLGEWEDRTDLVLSHCIACAEDDDGFDIYQVVAMRFFDKVSWKLSKHRPLESVGYENFIIWGFSPLHQSIFTMSLILLIQTLGLLVVIYKLVNGVYDQIYGGHHEFIQQCGMNIDRWKTVYSLKFLALLWSLIITVNIGSALSRVQHSGLYKIMYTLTFDEQLRLQYLFHNAISLWFLQLGQLINYFALLMAVVGSYFLIFIEKFSGNYYLTGINLILNAVALFFILELDDFVVTHQDYIDCTRILRNKGLEFLNDGKIKTRTFHKNHGIAMKYIFYIVSVIGVIAKALCYFQGLIAPIVIFFCW